MGERGEVSCAAIKAVKNCRVMNASLWLLQGRLTGLGGEDLPTIVIVAHYDSFGVAPVNIFSPSPLSLLCRGGSSCALPVWLALVLL